MPDQLQLRGGTTSEHNSFTGAAREVTVDTTKKTVVVHDGSTAGGTALMKESGGNSASSVDIGTGGNNVLNIDSNQRVSLTGANETTFDHLGTLSLSGTDAYNSGNSGAGITFNGKYQSGGASTTFAQLSGIKEDTGDGTYDAALTFGVRNDAEGVSIERMRIGSSGDVTIKNGNLILAVNKGIDFSATSNAGGMTSELFDSYEEGTWTLTDASGAGLTITNHQLSYVKVGTLVFVNFYITFPTTSDGTNSKFSGLPFTALANKYSYLNGRVAGLTNGIQFQVNQGTDDIEPYVGESRQTNAQFSGKHMLISGCYNSSA